jgi:acyl carrier protein
MMPSAFVLLDALPTTPTGKVDSRSLPPYDPNAVDDPGYVEPRSPLEREIAGMAAELLRRDRIGVRDDFFDAGGHSLLAARFVAELRARYGIDLLLEELFAAPTVERLAALVEAELARKGYLTSEEMRLRRTVDVLPDDAVDSLLRHLVAD